MSAAAVGLAGALAVGLAVVSERAVAGSVHAARMRHRLGPPGPTGRWAYPSRRRWFLPPRARDRIVAMALPVNPELAATLAVGATGGVAGGLVVVAGPGAAVVGAGATALVLGAAAFGATGRADRLVNRALPGVLDGAVAGLRSGASLPDAVAEGAARASGPLRADLDGLLARVAAGAPFPAAVRQWSRARPTPAVRATGAALLIAHAVGGGAARAIDGVAASVRDRLAVQQEVSSLSVQARSSAAVIVVAPLVFAMVTGAVDQQTWSFLVSTPVGLACLGVGILLDLAGGAWMAWVAHGVARP